MSSPWRKLPGTHPLPLDAIHDACLWPIGAQSPYTFCGAPLRQTTDSDRPQVYCEAHALLAYRPKPVKEQTK